MLEHGYADCPGIWLISAHRPGLICTRCAAEHPGVPHAVVAALKENNLAYTLSLLSAEGAALREQGTRPVPGRLWPSDHSYESGI